MRDPFPGEHSEPARILVRQVAPGKRIRISVPATCAVFDDESYVHALFDFKVNDHREVIPTAEFIETYLKFKVGEKKSVGKNLEASDVYLEYAEKLKTSDLQWSEEDEVDVIIPIIRKSFGDFNISDAHSTNGHGPGSQESEIMVRRTTSTEAGFLWIPAIRKETHVEGWPNITEVTPGLRAYWGKKYPDHTSDGFLCKVSPGLDIDIKHEAAALAVERFVRDRYANHGMFLVRVGMPPKRLIVFRTTAPFAKITVNLVAPDGSVGQKIEFLGTGNMFVAYGIHPDTKEPYDWPYGRPGPVKLSELIPIEGVEAKKLVDDIVQFLIYEFGYSLPQPTQGDGLGGSGSSWDELVSNIRAGHELHGSIRDLAAKMAGRGYAEEDAAEILENLMAECAAPHDDRWQNRWRDIPRMISTAWEKFAPGENQNFDPKSNDQGSAEPVPVQGSKAALAELKEACTTVAAASQSESSDTLSRQSFLLGQLVGSGRLDEDTARERLTEAASNLGLGNAATAAMITGGLSGGKLQPRLPTIKVIGGRIADNIEMAEAEIIASGTAVFQRGGVLVQPIKQEYAAADDKKTEVMTLREMQTENAVFCLNRYAAVFKKYDARSKKFVDVDPPKDLASGLLKKGTWVMPQVSGVITTPTMRPDGSILDQPGYDEATKLYYSQDRNVSVPPINSTPSRADAVEALDLLKSLLAGFPFETKLDQAVGLASVMTPILHGAFDVCPMFLMAAHQASTGKSCLVNVAAAIATGRPCPVITYVSSPEEMEKRLGAMIMQGSPLISLDNCSHDLEGDLLAQVTEQPLVEVRILGKSETRKCEWRGTLSATGNNVTLKGDMTRRGLKCNLDAKVERPELREFPFHPVKLAAADRGKYVHAILTIARAWKVAGLADPCGPIASYGGWSAAVRSPLVWLGCEDPVNSMDSAREEDPDRIAARGLIALWKEHLSVGDPYTTAAIIGKANEMTTGLGVSFVRSELRDLLNQEAGGTRGEIDNRRLGRWLISIKGQIHDGYRIVQVRGSSHGNRYTLEKVTSGNRGMTGLGRGGV
jgi:hypothetical protein